MAVQPDAPKQDERAFCGDGGEKSARLMVRQCSKKPLCAVGAVNAGETIQAVVITENGAIFLNRGFRAACLSMTPAQALDFTYSCQASTEHFQQCAEFAPLRNRGLGPLAVTVLPIALARG